MIISISVVVIYLFEPHDFKISRTIPAIIVGGVLSFLIITIYRLTLITLEPNMLPHEEKWGISVAVVLRVVFVLLFAFYVASCIVIAANVDLFWWENSDTKKGILQVLFDFRSDNPEWIFIIYIVTTIVFLVPIVLKLFLKDKGEYFSLKGIEEKKIIREHYKDFKVHYSRTFKNRFGLEKDYVELYKNPPFNTIRIDKPEPKLKSQNDFMKLFFDE